MKDRRDYAKEIASFFKQYKRMPSYSEVMNLFNLRSKDTAWRLVQKLIKQGSLEKDSKGKLLPKNSKQQLRLLGLIEAGFGSPAEEDELDRISLEDWLIEDEVKSFMLKVKGDSMIDAGIHPGDYCIVEKCSEAKPGDIIVALIDGSWTLKYLRRDKKGFFLEAANSRIKPVHPKEDLRIEAVVKALVRKYGN